MGLLERNTENFSTIPISNNAFEKIKAYARLMGNHECYGFLISPLEKNDGIVYDAILASDQEVSSSHARISGDAAFNMKEEIKNLGYKPIGFWHSHGNFGAFHSGTDDNNLESLLLSFAVNTEEKDVMTGTEREACIMQNDSLVIRHDGREYILRTESDDVSFRTQRQDKSYSGLVFGLTKDSEFFLHMGRQTLFLKKPVSVEIRDYHEFTKNITGIGYSIVVNNKGKCFAEIGRSYFCNSCNRLESEVKEGKVKVVIDDKINFSEQDLMNDLKTRVKDFDRSAKGGEMRGRFTDYLR